MASGKSEISLCAICGKATGSFTCRGCSQHFCTRHVSEHRQVLNRQMDEIMTEHDQLKDDLEKASAKEDTHALRELIDHWEQQSKQTIEQIASEYRRQLSYATNRSRNKITEQLDPIAEEMRKSCKDDVYVETDLDVWTEKLKSLKNESTLLPTVSVETDNDDDIPLITKLIIIETPDDIFKESIGNVKIEDSGKLIKHGFWSSFGTARGKDEYSSGCYQFYFKIENSVPLDTYGLFFGIVSKGTPMNQLSWRNPGCGWMGTESEYFCLSSVGGEEYQSKQVMNDSFCNFVATDLFELLLNCEKRKILLRNKRTQVKSEIIVDMNKYPFPWQLNFGLNSWYQSIRLLKTSDVTALDIKKKQWEVLD